MWKTFLARNIGSIRVQCALFIFQVWYLHKYINSKELVVGKKLILHNFTHESNYSKALLATNAFRSLLRWWTNVSTSKVKRQNNFNSSWAYKAIHWNWASFCTFIRFSRTNNLKNILRWKMKMLQMSSENRRAWQHPWKASIFRMWTVFLWKIRGSKIK